MPEERRMNGPLTRLLDAWLFRPDTRPGGGLKNTDRIVGASSSGSWDFTTIYQCPQCKTTWPKKPRFRSHPFPKDHRTPAYPHGEYVTLFLRCPGRPVKVVGP
jgi:hypothetical protein